MPSFSSYLSLNLVISAPPDSSILKAISLKSGKLTPLDSILTESWVIVLSVVLVSIVVKVVSASFL